MFLKNCDIYKRNNLIIKKDDVFKLFKRRDKTTIFADLAVENRIIPFPGFEEVKFDDNLWSIENKEKYGNTYQLYIHSLRVCQELLLEFDETGEEKYFYKAQEIIESWVTFSKQHQNEPMVWYDHPVSNRVQVFIYYIYLAQNNNMKFNKSLLKTVLKEHAEFLSDISNYKKNNHGLMMDRALLVLGNVLNDNKLSTIGKSRAISTFWLSYSSQGIHLENSPDYHTMVTKMYKEIEQYLNLTNDTLGEEINWILKLASRYAANVMMPNKKFPTIGDTNNKKLGYKKRYKNIFDIEAGISVIQNNNNNPMFMTFICGYSTMVHKHKDDLSITLNYNNKDFLVDPGKYNYSSSPIRKYITSKEAHSSFYLKNYDYQLKRDNRYTRKVSLSNFMSNRNYTSVSGYNKDYKRSQIGLYRNVIHFKKMPLVVIIDTSNNQTKLRETYIQNFNLHSDVILEKKDGNYIMHNEGNELTIKQLIPITKIGIQKGNINHPVALNSDEFSQVNKTKQLQYHSITKKSVIFITAIFDASVVTRIQSELTDCTLNINVNNNIYTIYL